MSNYHNFSQKTNWSAGSDAFDDVPFYLTAVNIPGINLSHLEVGGRTSTTMKISADTVSYSSLSFDMMIDEDFNIYKEMMKCVNIGINVENGTFGLDTFDFWLQLNNSKGNKVLKFDFYNCRIESIGDIFLDSQDESTEHTMGVEIVFDYFLIEDNPTMTLIT